MQDELGAIWGRVCINGNDVNNSFGGHCQKMFDSVGRGGSQFGKVNAPSLASSVLHTHFQFSKLHNINSPSNNLFLSGMLVNFIVICLDVIETGTIFICLLYS